MTTDIDGNTATNHAGFGQQGLFVLAGATLLATLGVSVASVALPTLAKFFSVSIADVQWVVLAYLISMTVTVAIAGWLGDLYGHRRVLTVGLGIFAISSAACALSPALPILVAARLAQGVGGAILMALPLSIARGLVGQERLGSAMGLFGTMSAAGTALGPSLGGMLIGWFGWQSAFVLPAIIATAMTGLSLIAIPRPAKRPAGGPSLGVPGLLAILVDRKTATGLVVNLMIATIMMSTLVVGPFFLSFGLGLDVATVGIVMAVGPVVAAFSGLPAGRATDRFGSKRVLVGGLVLIGFALTAFAVLPRLLGVAGYVAALAALTPGFQLFLAANNTATMTGAAEDRRGIMSGLLGLSRNIGFMVGASAMTALFALAAGSSEVGTLPPDAVSSAFTTTFLTTACLIPLALALALFGSRGEPH